MSPPFASDQPSIDFYVELPSSGGSGDAYFPGEAAASLCRVPISSIIRDIGDGHVSFQWKDYRDRDRQKVLTL